jgi:metal-sulfur cluster biosynthetic enzyme
MREDIQHVLSQIEHPEINASLVDLGMIKDVVCKQNNVNLTLKIPVPGIPIKNLLIQSIKQALIELDKNIDVEINVKEMNQKERDQFMEKAKAGWKY